jgi:CheY-like chemotaxis protein
VDLPEPSPLPPPGSSPRILVIDDEIPLLNICARALRPCVVELASSGVLALAKLATLPAFDLVLCDLHLGDINGRDLYRQACARSPELRPRFVFMTGDHVSTPPPSDDDDDFSAVRVLSKPFDIAVLRAVVLGLVRGLPPLAES